MCSKVGFLYSVLFYGRLNRFVRLCGFITFLWLMMWLNCGRLRDPLGHGEYVFIYGFQILYCIAD